MKISVIVPVYNVENYISECIESLLKQTMDDFEIIVVNDGTQDNSIDIIKSFRDERIKIVSQENSGLSAARNTGLRYSKGDYVIFVDSDDYLGNANCLKEMYHIIINEKSDIVAGNCIWYYDEKNNYSMERDMSLFSYSPMKSEDFLKSSLLSKRTYAPVWLNLYKRSLLVDNNIIFKPGIYHEDEEFTPRVLLKSNLVSIYNKDFYVYRQREGSITNSKKDIKRAMDILDICLELEKVSNSINDNETKILFKKYLVNMAIEQIYKYNLTNISKEIKSMIGRNAVTKGIKLKEIILKINIPFYIFLEGKYRKYKKLNY